MATADAHFHHRNTLIAHVCLLVSNYVSETLHHTGHNLIKADQQQLCAAIASSNHHRETRLPDRAISLGAVWMWTCVRVHRNGASCTVSRLRPPQFHSTAEPGWNGMTE